MGLIGDMNSIPIAKLREHPLLADKVYQSSSRPEEGDPQPLPIPYVMVTGDNGQYTSELMADMADKALFNYTTTIVCDSSDQLDLISEAIYDQWLNWRPVVPGRRCFRMKPHFSTPDNSTNRLLPQLLYRVDEWGLRSVKGKDA